MGLDQYLYAKKMGLANKLEGEHWKKHNQWFEKIAQAVGDDAKYMDTAFGGGMVAVEMKIGQWRKANAIHQWFVDNCQGGEDDCRTSYVSREQLKELKSLCEEVLAKPESADSDLPTAAGFFFGSTEYDDWYFEGLRETVEIVDRCLEMPEEWEFEYHSSW